MLDCVIRQGRTGRGRYLEAKRRLPCKQNSKQEVLSDTKDASKARNGGKRQAERTANSLPPGGPAGVNCTDLALVP